jgi:hypothetical protein
VITTEIIRGIAFKTKNSSKKNVTIDSIIYSSGYRAFFLSFFKVITNQIKDKKNTAKLTILISKYLKDKNTKGA